MHVLITARTFWDFTKTYFSGNKGKFTTENTQSIPGKIMKRKIFYGFEIRQQLANDPNTIQVVFCAFVFRVCYVFMGR